MAGIQQGPPPKGPANSTRFEIEVYRRGPADPGGLVAAIEEKAAEAGLTLTAVQAEGHYNDVDDRSRTQLLGELLGTVLTLSEIQAIGASLVPTGTRVDAQAWAVYRDLPPASAE